MRKQFYYDPRRIKNLSYLEDASAGVPYNYGGMTNLEMRSKETCDHCHRDTNKMNLYYMYKRDNNYQLCSKCHSLLLEVRKKKMRRGEVTLSVGM